MPSATRLLATGLGCGLLAFAFTQTFHWAYLAALGSMFWLAVRASGQHAPGLKQGTHER